MSNQCILLPCSNDEDPPNMTGAGKEIKEGNVVFLKRQNLEGWSGVTGIVLSYNKAKSKSTITLKIPNKLLPKGFEYLKEESTFYPVRPEDIKVLSPKEVFEKLCEVPFVCKTGFDF